MFDRAIKTAINAAQKQGLDKRLAALKEIRRAAQVGPDDQAPETFREFPPFSPSQSDKVIALNGKLVDF